jgi:hypothetical protein
MQVLGDSCTLNYLPLNVSNYQSIQKLERKQKKQMSWVDKSKEVALENYKS